MTHPAEIEPGTFERELRSGADVVVIDVRAPDDFGAWHIPLAGTSVVNVPEDDLACLMIGLEQ